MKEPRVFYVLPHLKITGGNKVSAEHVNHLTQRGHQVWLLTDEGKSPHWIEVQAQVGSKKHWRRRIEDDDVVVFTWDYDIDYVLKVRGKKFYLVQSFVHPLEDLFRLPLDGFISVSNYVRKHTLETYGVHSHLVLNAIDHSVYRPVAGIERVKNSVMALESKIPLKGFSDIEQAMVLVEKDFPQVKFFACEGLKVQDMAAAYSSAEIFVSGSWYEGFGLPVLEAMACGCAVVTTDSKGIDDFAIDGETCLKVPPRNPEAMSEAILRLLKDPASRHKLASNGQEMARKFTWERSIDALERILSLIPKFPDFISAYSEYSGKDTASVLEKAKVGSELAAKEFVQLAGNIGKDLSRYYETSQDYIYELLGAKLDHELYAKFYRNHIYPALSISGPEVLDFGGGIGDFSIQAALWGKQVTYCDVPSEAMSFAQWYFAKRGLPIRSFTAQSGEIPGQYDLIWCNAVLEHVANPEQVVGQMAKALKDGGVLYLLVDYSHDEAKFPMHTHRPDLRQAIEGTLSQTPGLERLEIPYSYVHFWQKAGPASRQAGEDVSEVLRRIHKSMEPARQPLRSLITLRNLKKALLHPGKALRVMVERLLRLS